MIHSLFRHYSPFARRLFPQFTKPFSQLLVPISRILNNVKNRQKILAVSLGAIALRFLNAEKDAKPSGSLVHAHFGGIIGMHTFAALQKALDVYIGGV